MKQREEERLKELHLRQLKLTDLTGVIEETESKIKLYAAKCDSLQNANQALEAKLVMEISSVKYLNKELERQDELYNQRLNKATLDFVSKE